MTALDEQIGGSHYKDMPIQPIVFCAINKLGPHETKIIKYVCRHDKKNGIEDLEKAKDMVQKLIEQEQIKADLKSVGTCDKCFNKHLLAKTFGYDMCVCACECHKETKDE